VDALCCFSRKHAIKFFEYRRPCPQRLMASDFAGIENPLFLQGEDAVETGERDRVSEPFLEQSADGLQFLGRTIPSSRSRGRNGDDEVELIAIELRRVADEIVLGKLCSGKFVAEDRRLAESIGKNIRNPRDKAIGVGESLNRPAE
jgi:hypothetical protein